MSSFDLCRGCGKSFKRLSTHISLNAVCADRYSRNTTSNKSAAVPIVVDSHLNTEAPRGVCTRLNLKSHVSSNGILPMSNSAIAAGGDKLPIADQNEADEDNFVVDDDNDGVPGAVFDEDFPDGVDVEDASDSKEEEEEGLPDRSVLDLYEKLFSLRSNPFDLDRFLARRRS